jgi:hypothetical protein
MHGVLTPRPIDERLRQQDARIWSWRDHLMGVSVITLTDAIRRRCLESEVEARIDLVLAVWKKEVHCG